MIRRERTLGRRQVAISVAISAAPQQPRAQVDAGLAASRRLKGMGPALASSVDSGNSPRHHPLASNAVGIGPWRSGSLPGSLRASAAPPAFVSVLTIAFISPRLERRFLARLWLNSHDDYRNAVFSSIAVAVFPQAPKFRSARNSGSLPTVESFKLHASCVGRQTRSLRGHCADREGRHGRSVPSS